MARRRGFLKAALAACLTTAVYPFSRLRAQETPDTTGQARTDSTAESPETSTADSVTGGAVEKATISIPLDRVTALQTVGGSAVLKIRGRAILFIRESDSTVRALQSACTHQQVTVKYDGKNNRIQCPAHGSRFDLEGNVIRGPAKHPLISFDARLKNDRIVLVLED